MWITIDIGEHEHEDDDEEIVTQHRRNHVEEISQLCNDYFAHLDYLQIIAATMILRISITTIFADNLRRSESLNSFEFKYETLCNELHCKLLFDHVMQL